MSDFLSALWWICHSWLVLLCIFLVLGGSAYVAWVEGKESRHQRD